jgi:cytochrome P450
MSTTEKRVAEADLAELIDGYDPASSPTQKTVRMAMHTFRPGDRVLVDYGAANRDAEHFPDGDSLDFELERPARPGWCTVRPRST